MSKKVTFFSHSLDITLVDKTKPENFSNYLPSDLNSYEYLRSFFDANNIEYENYFHAGHREMDTSKNVEYAFLASNDLFGSKIGSLTSHWYPLDVAAKLLRKDALPYYLERFGFNCLPTKRIKHTKQIDMENFIIKPIVGTLGHSIYNHREKNTEHNFAYKTYEDLNALLQDIPMSELNDILNDDNPLNNYCIQKANVSDKYEMYYIYGVTNSNCDVYFTRAGSTFWKNKNNYYGDNKRFFNETAENDLIANFVRDQNIKNASFCLQFIRMEDNLLYPIDWNFRVQLRPPIINGRTEELDKQLLHMYDIPNDLPKTWSDTWNMKHSPEKYNSIEE